MDRGESFCAGFGAEDHGGSACRSRQWRLVFFFFLVIMWWLFIVDVTIIGGFWGLKFCFFFVFFPLCGGYFLWLWLVVDLVI